MIRRPPRSTLDRSSAASDVYKRQTIYTVSNSAKQKIFIDSLGKDAIVTLVNKAITFTPPHIKSGMESDLNADMSGVKNGALEITLIKKIASNISILTTIFLSLIKMIIAPLVLSTLIAVSYTHLTLPTSDLV